MGGGGNIENDIAVGGVFKSGMIRGKINGMGYYKLVVR